VLKLNSAPAGFIRIKEPDVSCVNEQSSVKHLADPEPEFEIAFQLDIPCLVYYLCILLGLTVPGPTERAMKALMLFDPPL